MKKPELHAGALRKDEDPLRKHQRNSKTGYKANMNSAATKTPEKTEERRVTRNKKRNMRESESQRSTSAKSK